MDTQKNRSYEFGPFRLDATERMLLRDREPVPLTKKAFETLLVLVQHSGRVLEKDELMRTIWPDTFVEETTLAQNIFTLRRVLGETRDKNRYIETVPGRGYRFVAKVSQLSVDDTMRIAGNGSEPAPRSIAVLPFNSLSPDKEDRYFGLGMADALITKLSNVSKIIVRPTSAVLTYDLRQQGWIAAGKDLKVEFVLEGRILRSGDRVRVTAQLVDVDSGAPLWADKFDEKFVDIFTLQDKISERLVEALTLHLTG